MSDPTETGAMPSARAFAFGDQVWPGLAKLVEECGEVVQVVGKLMMTHGDPVHWSGDLRSQLVDEMADVLAAIAFVGEECLTNHEQNSIEARTWAKLRKFKDWHAHPELDRPCAPNTAEGDHHG